MPAEVSLLTAQVVAVTDRVLRQVAHDRRYLALLFVVPVLEIAMVWIFFEAVDNPFFDTSQFIPPTSAFIVHFLTYVLSAIVLVRERTAGTLSRMFVSGYRRGSIIAGYVLAYSILATVQALIVIFETNLLFELGYDVETWALLFLTVWLLAISSVALGILVSNFARNEGQVIPFIPLVLLVSVFFSGMIVAVEDLPEWVAWLHVITPMYYATEAIEAAVSGEMTWDWLSLVLFGVLVVTLATFSLRAHE